MGAISTRKIEKVPGHHEITSEIIKFTGTAINEKLLDTIDLAAKKGKNPKDCEIKFMRQVVADVACKN